MYKLIAIFMLAPLAALAQGGYGGGGGQTSQPRGEAPNSRTDKKDASAPTPPIVTVPAVVTPIEAPPAGNLCTKPDLSINIGKKAEADAFNTNVTTYRDCVQSYVNAQKTAADQHSAAANTMVQEFNAFSTELNSKFGKTK